MADVVTRKEFDGLRSDVTAIKKTLDDHVLSTLKSHGARLDGIDERLDGIDERLGGIDERLGNVETGVNGLSAEVHHVKAGVDRLTDHFGI